MQALIDNGEPKIIVCPECGSLMVSMGLYFESSKK